ncbi:5-oxoprolinase subunit PxpA [Zobellella maritima]|uniref:5-oxoprolinase subunit PxpA n=1 Tax=Zobellella maritima TaxID=2059725 RepID=UPI000E307C6D|nr:5-oxoprolinase subunit PxpA [Zobellella maritima]
MPHKLLLNCDLGESYGAWTMGQDEALMPWLDQASIACGFHASDPDTMAGTIALAKRHQVTIGAHPGYQDKEGFGRRSIPHAPASITHLVLYQAGALTALAGLPALDYVKPHGALYNDMMRDEAIFRAVLEALVRLPGHPRLMLLATPNHGHYTRLAQSAGVELLREAFADRAYLDDGGLAPRHLPGAVLDDVEQIRERVRHLRDTGEILSVTGKVLKLAPDTLCVHGDNANAVAIARVARQALSA